jgi:hypothetical protein
MGGLGSGGHNKLSTETVLERFNHIKQNRLRLSYHKWLTYQKVLKKCLCDEPEINNKQLIEDALRQIAEYRYHRADRQYFKQGNEIYYDNTLA